MFQVKRRLESFHIIIAALAALVFFVSTAVQAQNLIPIRIAATPDPVSLPQWIAMEDEIFQKYGLSPEETLFNVNYQGLLAIGAQQNDVSIQSDPPTVSLLAKGVDAIVVAVVARFTSGYKLVSQKSVNSLEELKSKNVAWPGGTGAEYALMSISRVKNFDVSSVNHMDLPPAEGIPLLLKGDVSAAIYWEPWPRIAVTKSTNGLKILESSEGVYESNMFITVRREFAEQHPEAVKNLLRVLKEAQAKLASNPERGVKLFKRRMRVDEQSAKESLNDYELMLTLDSQAASTAKGIGDWLHSIDRIENLPNWKEAFDAKYLNAVDSAATQGFPW